jgi:hypothetical protein
VAGANAHCAAFTPKAITHIHGWRVFLGANME